ncbi:MAG TPA: alternate-type signal peptide domain-containing protein [Aeromicrobium sp.]|nr:alternate-type signal peptide domain-containing protein [Aeromicrobium sp.]
MKKSTKGALAAAGAGVLLLGGAGTLAYWTDDATISGTTITSGHLTVDASDCDATNAVWTLEGDAFDPATDALIPGDTLTMNCDVDVDVEGTHFATVDIAATTPSGALAAPWDELTVGATVDGSATGGTDRAVNQGSNTIPVVITVAWPYGVEDNDLNGDLSTALDDIEITVTQNHG